MSAIDALETADLVEVLVTRVGSCPREWCRAVGKWPAVATAKSLAEASHLSTAVVITDLR